MKISTRPAVADDDAFLSRLFHEVHSIEFAPLQLPPAALNQLLDLQYRGQGMTYRSQFPLAEDRLLLLDGEPAGRLLLVVTPLLTEVVDFAVSAKYRNRGIGTAVLQQTLIEAAARQAEVKLSVRAGSPALALYQRLGFVVTGNDGLNLAMTYSSTGGSSLPEQSDAGATWQVEPELVEQAYSSAYFMTLQGKSLAVTAPGGEPMTMSLVSVERMRRAHESQVPGDSFTLYLSGPESPLLASQTVEIVPPNAQPMHIFLVATGREQGHVNYEAIFNRIAVEPSTRV